MDNNDLFCVIETTDREIFECPRSWYVDEMQKVFYPNGIKFKKWKGRTDKPPHSVGATWASENARLIRTYPDYGSAVQAAKQLERMNTSDEESYFNKSRASNAFRDISSTLNVQELFDNKISIKNNHQQLQSIQESSPPPPPSYSEGANHENCFVHRNLLNDTNFQYCTSNNIQSETGNKDIVIENAISENVIDISTLLGSIEILTNQHQNVVSSIARLEDKLNKVLEAVAKLADCMVMESSIKISQNVNTEENALKLVPVNTLENLEELNILLNNTNVFNIFVNEMSKYGGHSGHKVGNKIALVVVDHFFSREFLLECSWTGGTKDKTKKINFSAYKKLLLAFYKTVNNSDNRFTVEDSEKFLRAQLRNSKMRFQQISQKDTQEKLILKSGVCNSQVANENQINFAVADSSGLQSGVQVENKDANPNEPPEKHVSEKPN